MVYNLPRADLCLRPGEYTGKMVNVKRVKNLISYILLL